MVSMLVLTYSYGYVLAITSSEFYIFKCHDKTKTYVHKLAYACIRYSTTSETNTRHGKTLGSYFIVPMASDTSFAYTKCQSLVIGP